MPVTAPQLIEQAPGPRGSPQRPHEIGAASAPALPTETREKSTRSVSVAPHFGQAATSVDEESSSKAFEQCLQVYSKSGTVRTSCPQHSAETPSGLAGALHLVGEPAAPRDVAAQSGLVTSMKMA